MLTRRHRRLGIELLERRTMMAADLLNGALSVVGTAGNDNIQVQVAAGGTHNGELQVDVNGQQSFFNVNQVNSIRIFGLAGNDQIAVDDNVSINTTINGGKGNDTIKGGTGNDTIHGDAGNDTIDGSAGNDTIFGDKGNDSIHGGNGDDTAHGDSGNDSIWGGEGDDFLFGDAGNDSADGEEGNDNCHGNNGTDDVHGGDGSDEVYGDNGNDSLWGGDDDDYVEGGNGTDNCHGGFGDDQLKGGRGHDQLDGDDGDDLLDGDKGNDDLTDGVEADLDNEFRALISGPNGASGKAKYDTQNDNGGVKTKFEIDVENLTPNSTMNVVVDGVAVGQINTNGTGDGELKLSTDPSGGELAFPVGFPTLHVGSTIVIGSGMQGTFVAWHCI